MIFGDKEYEADQPGENEKDNEQAEWGAANSMAVQVDTETVTVNGEEINFELHQVVTPMLATGFGILAPNWQVTESECEQLSQAWCAVADVWFPDLQISPKWGALGTAVMVTGMVFMPRMATPRKKPEEKEVNEAPKQ